MRAPWPEPHPEHRDERSEAELAVLTEVVGELRRFRADHGLAPAARMQVRVHAADARRDALDEVRDGVARLAGVAAWELVDDEPHDGPHGRVPVEGADLFVVLEGLVDLAEESERLGRELATATAEIDRARRKLDNTGFVAKAPAELVDAERRKLEEWSAAEERLRAQLHALS